MPSDHPPHKRRRFHLGVRRPDLVAGDLDAEIQHHLDARIAYLVARGYSEESARAEALRRLGSDPTEALSTLRASALRREHTLWRTEWWSDVRHDLAYAGRGLLRHRGFSTVAVLTLAIGIGANTAVFSAVNTLLLRPLPFPDAERLMDVALTREAAMPNGESRRSPSAAPVELSPWSFAKHLLYRNEQRSFRDIALWTDAQFNVTNGDAERIPGETVSARYLATLGVHPIAGRDFAPALDQQRRAPRQLLISAGLWSRRFNADPLAIGRTIDINREPYEVIGVVPAGFRGLSGRAEIIVPITIRPADELAEPWSLEFSMVGRLRSGISSLQAASEAAALGQRIHDATPMTGTGSDGGVGEWRATARPLDQARLAPTMRLSLLVIAGAVGFVLLIACVNLANLLLGRAQSRQREMAIRLALGASRARVVRFLLTESALLSLVGGVASLAIAWWGTHLLSTVNPVAALQAQNLSGIGVVGFEAIRLDFAALAFTFAITVVIGIVFGLLPAVQSTRPAVQQELKFVDAGTSRGGRPALFTGRRVLVVAEVAMAIVLLSGAGLMLRSLERLLGVSAGFDAGEVLTMRLNVPPTEVPRDSMPGFYHELLRRLAALPGVTDVGLADCPPLNGGCNGTVISLAGRATPSGSNQDIGVHWVTPGWFSALRVPLKRGRLFTEADRLDAAKVLMISETAARRYWPNADPIGQRVAVYQGGFHTGATVVGIVGDVRFGTIDSLPVPDAYISYEQSPQSRMMVFLRTGNDVESVVKVAREAVLEVSPSYPAYDVRTLHSRVAVASAQARLSALLLGSFAVIALALATIGVYGVMSFAVAQRTRELGIRMAMGAGQGAVLRLVLSEGMRLAVVGMVIGLLAALSLSRVLAALLYEVSPTDPLTFAAMFALLGAAAIGASWFPAHRASRLQPRDVLGTG